MKRERKEPVFVFPLITLWRARTELKKAGLLEKIDAYIDAKKDANPALYQAWNYGNFLERNSAFVKEMQAQFGLPDAQVDAMFAEAAKADQ
jgi:hypothetical protein